jgi:hypothetical protein
MWKLSCGLLTQLMLAISIWSATFLPAESEAAPGFFPPSELGSSNFDQLATLLREYVKLMEKVQTQPKHITGQMSLRAPRSELIGEMANAQKLHQLQELDRMYGTKSRPRFGKRNWVSQEDVPLYGYYESNPNE